VVSRVLSNHGQEGEHEVRVERVSAVPRVAGGDLRIDASTCNGMHQDATWEVHAVACASQRVGMETLERAARTGHGHWNFHAGRAVLQGLSCALRLLIVGPLAILEPLINRSLSMGFILGLLCCLLFKLEDGAGAHHHFPYILMLCFSFACGALLTLYFALMRRLAE
jgi:hypothetical protein